MMSEHDASVFEQIIEELLDEHEQGEKMTRYQIGKALLDWKMNSAENIRIVIDMLDERGVSVKQVQ